MIFAGAFARSGTKKDAAAGPVPVLDRTDAWPRSGTSADTAMKVSTVCRCVEVRSGVMAVLPVYLLNEKTKERVSDHYLAGVLWGQANEAMSNYDFQRLMAVNQDLKGNAYAWLRRVNGRLRERIPLPPECVQPWFDGNGHLWYRFCDPRTGRLWDLPPEDVLHYKGFSTDGIRGVSVLARAAQTIGIERAAGRYEESFYANSGRPSGVLTADTDLNGYVEVRSADGAVSQRRAKDVVRDDWERMYSGTGNAFRTAVLDLGLKYQPLSVTSADAQFVESKEVRVADICRYFGVPLHLVYAGKESYASNEQNSLEFVKYSKLPDITQWNQEDTNKLLLPGDRAASLRIKRELKVYLQGDAAAQAAWYSKMAEAGVYSVDDIRDLEDLPRVPGGSARRASLNYVPLEHWAEISRARAEETEPGQSQ